MSPPPCARDPRAAAAWALVPGTATPSSSSSSWCRRRPPPPVRPTPPPPNQQRPPPANQFAAALRTRSPGRRRVGAGARHGDALLILVLMVPPPPATSDTPYSSSTKSTTASSGRPINQYLFPLSGKTYRRFPLFMRSCATGHAAAPVQRSDVSELCAQMMLRFRDLYDPIKVDMKVRIVHSSPSGGMVAEESKRALASWVVLDRDLKLEERLCMQEMQCNIVVMKRS